MSFVPSACLVDMVHDKAVGREFNGKACCGVGYNVSGMVVLSEMRLVVR